MLKWILQNPYAEGGRSLRVVKGIIGCLLCMNVCRTFVTGVGKSLMMTKIAFYGLVVKELYSWKSSNLVHGYEHHSLTWLGNLLLR